MTTLEELFQKLQQEDPSISLLDQFAAALDIEKEFGITGGPEKAFEQMDTNGDKQLSLEEFVKALGCAESNGAVDDLIMDENGQNREYLLKNMDELLPTVREKLAPYGFTLQEFSSEDVLNAVVKNIQDGGCAPFIG